MDLEQHSSVEGHAHLPPAHECFANMYIQQFCICSEITFELFQKFRELCGWKAKTRRNRFSIDFNVCQPRWLWQRLWEGEIIIPTTDINLFLCLKTQHSTTHSICETCKDNNSCRKKLDKLWTILFLVFHNDHYSFDHNIITTLYGIARVTTAWYDNFYVKSFMCPILPFGILIILIPIF